MITGTNPTEASPGGEPRAPGTQADVVHTERDFTLMSFNQVFVVIFHRHTTVSGAATLRRSFAAFAGRQRAGAALLTVVEPNAPMPSREAREALASFMADNGDTIMASAVVYEGTGFRAAAVRSVVTGVTMLARQPFPHKVFATIETASEWLVAKMRGSTVARTEANELIDAVSAARADLPKTHANN